MMTARLEIEQAFKDSIDDYLEWLKNEGRKQKKPIQASSIFAYHLIYMLT